MSISSFRINALSKINNAQRYLEIGVSNGFTFNSVEIKHRDAVDVRFGFNTGDFANAETRFFEISSDIFFETLSDDIRYDIIFIDGLHTFEQTLRDFSASLRFSHDKTIWIIDDTIPSDVFSGLRSPSLARRFRDAHGLSGSDWHGDVYKLVALIHDYFPTIDYRTTAGPNNAQTIAMWGNRKSTQFFKSVEEISRLDFFGLDEFSSSGCFHLSDFEDIVDWISRRV